MSEPSSLDSLPDGKSVVWNVANEIDLGKSSIWSDGQLAKSLYRYGTPVVPGHSLEDSVGRVGGARPPYTGTVQV